MWIVGVHSLDHNIVVLIVQKLAWFIFKHDGQKHSSWAGGYLFGHFFLFAEKYWGFQFFTYYCLIEGAPFAKTSSNVNFLKETRSYCPKANLKGVQVSDPILWSHVLVFFFFTKYSRRFVVYFYGRRKNIIFALPVSLCVAVKVNVSRSHRRVKCSLTKAD